MRTTLPPIAFAAIMFANRNRRQLFLTHCDNSPICWAAGPRFQSDPADAQKN